MTKPENRKPFCYQGHLYSGKNLRMETITDALTGKSYEVRRCKACQSQRVQDWMRKNGKKRSDYAKQD